MSDLLIKNMEMPKCCEECALYDEDYCECRRETNLLERTITRENGCPLVEIPPHGRLIDADKLAKSLELWSYSAVDEYCTMTISNAIVKEILSQAPTVLEASNG